MSMLYVMKTASKVHSNNKRHFVIEIIEIMNIGKYSTSTLYLENRLGCHKKRYVGGEKALHCCYDRATETKAIANPNCYRPFVTYRGHVLAIISIYIGLNLIVTFHKYEFAFAQIEPIIANQTIFFYSIMGIVCELIHICTIICAVSQGVK